MAENKNPMNSVPFSKEIAQEYLSKLGGGWELDTDAKTLVRQFRFKGYAKATYLTNLCVWLADQEGHHPDISFGWGYVTVQLTSHDLGGLSEHDFSWAAKLNHLVG